MDEQDDGKTVPTCNKAILFKKEIVVAIMNVPYELYFYKISYARERKISIQHIFSIISYLSFYIMLKPNQLKVRRDQEA